MEFVKKSEKGTKKKGGKKRVKGIKGGKLSKVCFPVYEYLPWNEKKTIKIHSITKAGKAFERFILKPREILFRYLIKKQY